MDPKVTERRRQQTVEAVKLDLIEEEIMDKIERILGMDQFSPEANDVAPQDPVQEEDANVVYEDGAEVAPEPVAQEDAPKADDQVTAASRVSGLTNSISNIEAKTAFSMKSGHSKRSVFSKMSKGLNRSEVFETRSIKPNITKQQSLNDRCL